MRAAGHGRIAVVDLSRAGAPHVASSHRQASDVPTPDAPALAGGLDLPYLVYGTLRPGGSNAALVERHGGVHAGSLTLGGYAMYEAPAGYPYIVPRSTAGAITLDVLVPPAGAGAQESLRADLDTLEGFEVGGRLNHYERVAVSFPDPATGSVRWGWLYVAGPGALIDGLAQIESGDWFAR